MMQALQTNTGSASSDRTWQALLLALFFNMESNLYYELFSGWMGKGDKDSFAHALAATRTPFSTVATPVGAVGTLIMVRDCSMASLA